VWSQDVHIYAVDTENHGKEQERRAGFPSIHVAP
jgi:hypothetical protein